PSGRMGCRLSLVSTVAFFSAAFHSPLWRSAEYSRPLSLVTVIMCILGTGGSQSSSFCSTELRLRKAHFVGRVPGCWVPAKRIHGDRA
ncbi:hypothetical protein BDV11DRAFT_183495, partial [Aspergillus similis]